VEKELKFVTRFLGFARFSSYEENETEDRISFKQYIKVQFVPHRKQILSKTK
jgi:hypothetical protein